MNRLAIIVVLVVSCAFPLGAQRRPSRRTAPKPKSAPSKPAPPAAAPRVERPVPFRIGEALTYDISWSSYLTAGTVVASVQEKRPSNNSTAYYIVAEARPTTLISKLYSLYYKIDTLLDSHTLLPQRGSIYSEEGSRHRYRTTRFDRTAQRAFFEYQTDHVMKSDFSVSPVAQDVLSALYVLRAIPLKPNDRMTMPVSDNGTTYRVQLEVGPLERVKTAVGEFDAWKVKPTIFDAQGQSRGRNLFIWISEDARHLPVKIQGELPVGSFVLLLREAH